MALTSTRNGKAHVFEVSNRALIQDINSSSLATVKADLDSHKASGNTAAHGISNITGLQTALNGKANVFSGYTGSLTVVKSVDFTAQTVTTATINVNNGIITSII